MVDLPFVCRALALVVLLTAGLAPAAQKPNVLILLADDQGWGDLSFTGNSNVQTPNIDSLARAGTSFERFYVCPVCAPTRAEFLTGRYHSRGGVRGVSTGQERLNLDEKTIAEAFKAAGYATGAFGKWHNGSQWPYHPNARGFDEYCGFTSGHWGEYFDPPLDHNGQPERGHGYIADIFTDRAIEFIEKNKSRPFFCYVPYNIPHSPFAVPPRFWERLKNKPVSMRASSGLDEDLDVTRCVLAMCENLDWNVGRLLSRLDELNLATNTIAIYFSDNGPASWRWNGGMKGRKGSVDEGGVRVPFFIRWPGRIEAGGTIPQIAGAIDLLPTLVKMAGISRFGDKPLDGKDLSPLLMRSSTNWPERMIFSHQNGKVSVRTQQYRLDGAGELFDMGLDPGQTKNIARENTELASTLGRAITDWRKQVFGPSGKPAPENRPFPIGYLEFPRTPLPARDGVAHGAIRRSASAPNSSYFVNWRKLDDKVTWDVEVHRSGEYEVELLYTCPMADAGAVVELSLNGDKLSGKITPGWDPPLYTNQDTIERPLPESRMKEFRSLHLGRMHLEKGRGPLTLRALSIPGRTVMDLRQVNLTLTQPVEGATASRRP